jgi:hypothetical protein
MYNYPDSISYIDAFWKASQDDRWSKKEKEVLTIIGGTPEEEFFHHDYPVNSIQHGSGRIFSVKGSSIKFYIHEAAKGYNIGRA